MSTLPENFDNPRSDCHGWSSHILYHYFATILGLRPRNIEKNEWNIEPLFLDLDFANGKIPIGNDFIGICIRKISQNKFYINCIAPKGIKLFFQNKETDGMIVFYK